MLLARRLSLRLQTKRLFPLYSPPPPPLRVLHRLLSYPPPPEPLLPSDSATLRGGCDGGGADPPPPLPPLCPGCGVHMQGSDSSLPGFFTLPSPKSPDYHAPLDRSRPLQSPLDLKLQLLQSPNNPENPNPRIPPPLVCARCHSLRHYGRVKHPVAESLLPSFDFDRTIAPKILSPNGPRSLALVVADAADFDGSLPRSLARLLSAAADRNSRAYKDGKPGNTTRLLLVVTKTDLIHSSVSPEHLEEWVRHRAHDQGAGRLAGVHLVSSVKDWGVRGLLEHVMELVGPRGNVWAIGAQNAGKSTLINAMAKCASGEKGNLTEAPVPGTTLGIVRVEGVLGGQAKLFDTPGILHPYQITMRLTREEQRLVNISKELRPRTYRIKAGHSVHIGGLMRVDVEKSSVDSVYLTVWASALLPLHMGKTENASTMMEDHFGRQLQPPIGESRVRELGKWVRSEFNVRSNSWESSSVDIAVAGLGWVAVGLKGEALLGVWTYDGVDVISRSSLISKRAWIFEEAGFSVSKIVSRADSALNKSKHNKAQKKLQLESAKAPLVGA